MRHLPHVLGISRRLAYITLLSLSLTAHGQGSDTGALAEKLIDQGAVDRGLSALLGADRDLALHLVQGSNLLVHVREPDGSKVSDQQRSAEEVEIGIDRLVVEQGGLGHLPYADNMVDLIMATGVTQDLLSRLSLPEFLRALRPEGRAIVVSTRGIEAQALRRWAAAGRVTDVKVWQDDHGTWLRLTKPPLQGVDEWRHWERSPDNNPVSTDQVIKAPYMTQFLAEPYYIAMPAITTAAGGRTFLATGHIAHHAREWDMVNKLIARNGYNGIVLWQRDLPKGYLSHRSAFCATADTFYMIEGDRCLMLDPETGEEKGHIEVPGMEGDWKWMVIQDGILYAMAGEKDGDAKAILGNRNFGGWSWADLSEGYYKKPSVPWGFGDRIAAFRLDGEQLLWCHHEDSPIDSRALAMRDGKLYLYSPGKHFRSLDIDTAEVLWTNSDPEPLGLLEKAGQGLTSTPGFRSGCLAVATPEALILQGQTRQHVVAISTENGKMLWEKEKVTNNPNVIYVDGRAIMGVGRQGRHVAVDPASGEVIEDLNFRKAACTRLTACPDSLFVRGEGTLRYDWAEKRAIVDGAVRPACNDGVIAANGMLYIGPWACDCNLSLIGAMAKCSAGSFRFDHVATEAERLQLGKGDLDNVQVLETSESDWPTYRGNNHRTSATSARLARPDNEGRPWVYRPGDAYVPTAPTSAGGLIFIAGDDGKVRALDGDEGTLRWTFSTAGPIKTPPTIWDSRLYVGSGDGHVYALEAASGRLLWRFRAAPVERHIMVYGNLSSTWPVHTGVLIHDGIAYFGAGIIDRDGTYVYALDARTGRIKWQNNSSGHLSADLRKGVSAQGCLTIHGDELLMAGGNQVNPARFELKTGRCLNESFAQGNPKANHGKFVGVLPGGHPIAGGRVLHAPVENVANKDSFVVKSGRRYVPMNFGGIPPAWNAHTVALVNFRDGRLTCFAGDSVVAQIEKGQGLSRGDRPGQQRWMALTDALDQAGSVRWETDLDQQEFEVVSLAVCPQAVVAVAKYQVRARAHPEWFLVAFDAENGTPFAFWRHRLPSKPLPDGLLVDREGQVIVTMLDGNVHRFTPIRPRQPQADRARATRD